MGKRVTIYTLADELGMSPSAVSRAFNPQTRLAPEKRKLILDLAAKYNFIPNRAAASLTRREIKIGVIMFNRIPTFSQGVYNGISSMAKQLLNFKVNVDIHMLEPGNIKVDTLIDILNSFQEKKYDGIILHGIYNADIVHKVNELVDNGIPVATLVNDIPASKRLFTSTINAPIAASIAAELLSRFTRDDRKNVLLFSGNMNSSIHQQIHFTFSKQCAAHGLNLIRSYDTMDVPEFAETMIKEALTTFDNINGIYCSSSNSIPICEYLEKNGYANEIVLITSDIFPQLNDFLRKGIVSATIYQEPYLQGKNALGSLYDYISEKIMPPEFLMVYPQIVVKSNLEMFEHNQESDA